MVKLLPKNLIVDSETFPKSTLQLLFLCSIVGNSVFARKDDKSYESKNYPSPTYRFNEEVESGFDNDNRNYKGNPNQPESTWNGMKGVYGYRNSDAFRMMDYLGRSYDFNGKSLEPGVSSSNPTDVVIRGKDSPQETKAKIHIKNLIQNHRLEQEMMEQKPERLTQINGDEGVDEEEEETTETPTTTTTTTTTTTPPPESTSTSTTTATTLTTTATSPAAPTASSVLSLAQSNNRHREVEGRKSVSLPTSLSMTNPTPSTLFPESLSSESMKHKKSLHNKLSVHQLISESMPTLQMSVSPIYFYNKQTRSLVAIPYLIMKSISKMPLLPGMMDSIGAGPTGGSNNLINYINTPFNQKLHSRPINHLSPLLEGIESRSSIDDKLTDLSYSSHHDEPETSASSRWITISGSNNGQQLYRGIN